MSMRLSEKWREWKVALTFSEFCSFGEHGKLEPEQGSMARAGQQATSPVMDVREGTAVEVQEIPVLEQCKIPTGVSETL